MKAFLDSSVLLAAFYGHHEHHAKSLDLLLRFKKVDVCCGAHSLAEVYSVMTGRLGRERVGAEEALLFLGEIRERFSVVTLSGVEYARAIEEAAALGITGGGIYDALLVACSAKADAEVLYTWNVKHFERLGRTIAGRVRTP